MDSCSKMFPQNQSCLKIDPKGKMCIFGIHDCADTMKPMSHRTHKHFLIFGYTFTSNEKEDKSLPIKMFKVGLNGYHHFRL